MLTAIRSALGLGIHHWCSHNNTSTQQAPIDQQLSTVGNSGNVETESNSTTGRLDAFQYSSEMSSCLCIRTDWFEKPRKLVSSCLIRRLRNMVFPLTIVRLLGRTPQGDQNLHIVQHQWRSCMSPYSPAFPLLQ